MSDARPSEHRPKERVMAEVLGKARRSWKEIVFLVVLVMLGLLYLGRPGRIRAVQMAVAPWYQRLKKPPQVLKAPCDLKRMQLEGLARFGGALEFLGCDVALVRGPAGVQVWQITLWRLLQPVSEDYILSLDVVPDLEGLSLPLQIEHPLGQGYLPAKKGSGGAVVEYVIGGETQSFPVARTSTWRTGSVVADATLLSTEVVAGQGYSLHVEVLDPRDRSPLPVHTQVLSVDAEGRLIICR